MRRIHKYADGGKVVKSETDVEGYDTVDDAAAAAQYVIDRKPNSDNREYIGLVYQDPKTGKYFITDPSNSHGNARGKDRARGKFTVPAGSLRGLVHNHPTGGKQSKLDAANRHSSDDVRQAKELGVPSYVGVNQDLLSWNPKGGRMFGKQGLGEPVLAKIPLNLLPKRRGTSEQLAKTPAPTTPPKRGSR